LGEDNITVIAGTIGSIFLLFLLIHIYFRLRIKKTKVVQLLFWVFSFFTLAMIMNTIGTILYRIIYEGTYPTGPFSFVIERLLAPRFSLFFIIMAIYFSYLLKLQIFNKEVSPIELWFYRMGAIIIGFFTLFIYEWDNGIYDVITFLLVFLYMFAVYLPFIIKSFKLARKIEEKIYQRAIYSLTLMGICFNGIFLFFFLDELCNILWGLDYTIFYSFAWIFAPIGAVFAYFGYIAPYTRKEKPEK
jgi:hypothetical protein